MRLSSSRVQVSFATAFPSEVPQRMALSSSYLDVIVRLPTSAIVGEDAPSHASQAERLSLRPHNQPNNRCRDAPEQSPPIASTEPEAESLKKFTKSYGP